jgi:hypothetical protein
LWHPAQLALLSWMAKRWRVVALGEGEAGCPAQFGAGAGDGWPGVFVGVGLDVSVGFAAGDDQFDVAAHSAPS